MNKTRTEGKKKLTFFGIAALVFTLSFVGGVHSEFLLTPSWLKQYSVEWSDELGTLKQDVPYGEGEAQKFDLYLPKDQSKDVYGLVVYLHGGGFTAGDKSDERKILAWLCQKGYVAAGINYTLRNDKNDASVLSQSQEIKAAIPKVVEAAKEAGYPVDRMAIAGGSAGHTLAMIYAYRDAQDAPVPVVFTYGSVGPSSLHKEDWSAFGLDWSDERCAALFGVMAGVEIAPEEIADGSYLEKVKPISAVDWIAENPIPTVVAYGACDKIQPFAAALRLKKTLEDNGVDFRFFELPHSGHGLQNDSAIARKWMETVEAYLERLMP
jgi:acetyl esterase/lipase